MTYVQVKDKYKCLEEVGNSKWNTLKEAPVTSTSEVIPKGTITEKTTLF